MLHPNEVIIANENYDTLLEIAKVMSSRHVAALNEQVKRQSNT